MGFVPDKAVEKPAGRFVPDTSLSQTSEADGGEAGAGSAIGAAVAPTVRGAGPYAAGAAVGAAIGAPIGGVGAVPGAFAGAAAVGAADLVSAIYNPLAGMIGLPHMKGPSEAWGEAMTKAGVPESTTGAARIQERTAGGIAGAAAGPAAFRGMAGAMQPGAPQKVMSEMAKGPGGQMAAGATSAAAGQAAAEAGAGPGGQVAASLAGGLVPSAASAAASGVLRGQQSTAAAQARMNRAHGVGMEPTLAYVTPSVAARGAQKMLSGTEESQAYLARATKQMENRANQIAASVGKAVDENTAGRMIESALGKEGFMHRARAAEDSLWNRWWNVATGKTGKTAGGPAGEMPMPNTMAFLQQKQANIPGAENLSELMKDPMIGKILKAMEADMPAPKTKTVTSPIVGPEGQPITQQVSTPGKRTIPYEAIKQLRTIVGEKLDPSNLSPDVSKTALKALYKVLTEDIGNYAKGLGKDAESAFKRADTFTRGKNNRIESYLQDTQGRKPYDVWRYATSPDSVANGGRQFLTLNRSMNPAEREVFHATFIKQMGRDNTGAWNPETFAQKYRQLSPMVRSALLPGDKGKSVGNLVQVIDDMGKAGVLGSAPTSGSLVGAYIMMGALLHAHPKALVTALFASSKSENIAKALTNKNVIDYVAGVNKIPPAKAAVALQALSNSMQGKPTEE